MTCADDDMSTKVEPGAPPTSERLDWAVHLAEMGYMVILAFNPLVEKWMPQKALENILDVSILAGIRNFYFDSLHLEKKRTYPKELLELTGVTAEYLDSVEVDWDTENYVLDVMEAAMEPPFPAGVFAQTIFATAVTRKDRAGLPPGSPSVVNRRKICYDSTVLLFCGVLPICRGNCMGYRKTCYDSR